VIICEKAGTREKCGTCEHSTPHEGDFSKGCEHGFCYPPITDSEGMTRQQNYKCVEIQEDIDVDI
jgi:hypothetical protein